MPRDTDDQNGFGNNGLSGGSGIRETGARNVLVEHDFQGHCVRAVLRDGSPWFVAADVCNVLDHTNPSVAVGRLEDDEKG